MNAHQALDAQTDTSMGIPRRYAWLVFALTFGLLISDYMSRQVLNAVFPLLKSEWMLTDSQLGWLSGIVALMVGLLTLPLSFFIALILPIEEPTTIVSPTSNVPLCTSIVAIAPFALSRRASITAPFACFLGFAFNSNTSASNNTISNN